MDKSISVFSSSSFFFFLNFFFFFNRTILPYRTAWHLRSIHRSPATPVLLPTLGPAFYWARPPGSIPSAPPNGAIQIGGLWPVKQQTGGILPPEPHLLTYPSHLSTLLISQASQQSTRHPHPSSHTQPSRLLRAPDAISGDTNGATLAILLAIRIIL